MPTPYWIIAPGTAVDLSRSIAVDGHAPPRDRYYLTDVTLSRATGLTWLAGFVPGSMLVKQDVLVPAGESLRQYDRTMGDAMTQSQGIAALVAERAVGLRVAEPPEQIVVGEILSNSRAGTALHIGDVLERVAGRPILSPHDVALAVTALRAGTPVRVLVRRDGNRRLLAVTTMATVTGTRFGIRVERTMQQPDLPVPVRFSLGNIAGSSGGLMFALHIYGTLCERCAQRGALIAGTGALSPDGRVQPIEGTRQKLIAAKRAGARVFLVPRENYPEIAAERGIRIVPVDSFHQALQALAS
ncbi:MAG: hypothetical protein GIW95_00250 [Candidatus Eremiobacteraeota bacterium]|nr:hypothetical protein [Candidatus Eremiobacteraeota bacterium]